MRAVPAVAYSDQITIPCRIVRSTQARWVSRPPRLALHPHLNQVATGLPSALAARTLITTLGMRSVATLVARMLREDPLLRIFDVQVLTGRQNLD